MAERSAVSSWRPRVSVDFDGTLHPYTRGWRGVVPDDEPPIGGAAEFLRELRTLDYEIIVCSTRCASDGGTEAVWEWLRRYGLADLIADVTCQKPAAVAYVDDRAVPFLGDWVPVLKAVQLLTKPKHA